MSDYNYTTFDLGREEPYFRRFRDRLHVGERAPAFALEELTSGNTVTLKELARPGLAVLEFGSFT